MGLFTTILGAAAGKAIGVGTDVAKQKLAENKAAKEAAERERQSFINKFVGKSVTLKNKKFFAVNGINKPNEFVYNEKAWKIISADFEMKSFNLELRKGHEEGFVLKNVSMNECKIH